MITNLIQDPNQLEIIACSYNRPLQLDGLLRSIDKHFSPIPKISVILKADEPFVNAYKCLIEEFSTKEITFVWEETFQSNTPWKQIAPFFPCLLSTLSSVKSEYLTFAMDDQIVFRPVDIGKCIDAMQRENAYVFHLALSGEATFKYDKEALFPPLHQTISDPEIICWELQKCLFAETKPSDPWRYPHSLDLTIFPTERVQSQLTSLTPFFEENKQKMPNGPNQVEVLWTNSYLPLFESAPKKKALSFIQQRCVNFPLNRVQNQYDNRYMVQEDFSPAALLKSYESGERIDLEALEEKLEKAHPISPHYYDLDYLPKRQMGTLSI
jgi:hypothetical protein